MKHKLISFMLAVILLVTQLGFSVGAAEASGLSNFKEIVPYEPGTFTDVPSGAWYEGGVVSAYRLGLMKGSSPTTFSVSANLTVGEAVALAARIHALYTSGSENFAATNPWYKTYVDYSLASQILKTPFTDYTKAATRIEFSELMAASLPDEALIPIGTVLDGSIPDVPVAEPYAPAVYTLYRAGILSGSDAAGFFNPQSNIQRCEVATIISRMTLPALRLKNDFQKTTLTLYAADGRTSEVPFAAVPSNLAVGWYRSTADALHANPGVIPDSNSDKSTLAIRYVAPAYQGTTLTIGDADNWGSSRIEISDCVTIISNRAFTSTFVDNKVTRLGIPETAVIVEKEAFDPYLSKGITVFCPRGSAAETEAKAAGLKVTYARSVYSLAGCNCMVTDAERPFYLSAGWYDTKQQAEQAKEVLLSKSVQETLSEVDGLVGKAAYVEALEKIEAAQKTFDADSPHYATLEQKSRTVADTWRNTTACPFGISGYSVDDNSIGIPEVTLYLRNISYKTIVAYKVKFDCYDAFGAPARELFSRNYTFRGYSDDDNLAPLDTTYPTWTMNIQDSTKVVKNIQITQIIFSDGTSWSG